ncbi:MAG: DnaB-like helicase C-terminal domain-containing protein [Chloroflexota bacterium]
MSTTKPKRDDFRVLVHSPAQLAQSYVAWAERIQATEGCTWGIPAIDKVVIPIRAGEMGVILGRPGHGKTSILAYLARTEARRILARGKRESECVVFVTWEESAEELTKMFIPPAGYTITDLAWGRVPLDVIKKQASQLAQFPPVWIIGHGIERARQGKRAPDMTPEAVLSAIETMEEDYGIKPTLTLFDYIQRVPVRRIANKVEEVTEAVKSINDLGMRIGCPVYVGAQARQEVDRYDNKMPTAADCQWASAILQDADKLYALLRPAQYLNPSQMGKEFYQFSDGRSFAVTEDLMILKMWKQRGDVGNHVWGLYFEPETLTLGEMEVGR